jgi:hypothetical protein
MGETWAAKRLGIYGSIMTNAGGYSHDLKAQSTLDVQNG